jgi:SAM-dependent methyltransferase
MNLDGAQWDADALRWRGLTFRFQDHRVGVPGPVGPHFQFFKDRALVAEFEEFFSRRPDFQAHQILELGIFDGGSLAFWAEALHPRLLVGIDYGQRGDSDYFQAYLTARRPGIRTYWGVDQADRARLEAILAADFDGPLDLVLDDASHHYAETKASFEILFPHVRPGGFYVIEDWSWWHWPEYQAYSPYRGHVPLSRLVQELVEATGTRGGAIQAVTVLGTVAVVERGPAPLPQTFTIESQIFRDPIHHPRALWPLLRQVAAEIWSRLRHGRIHA